jgi:hypothetical protein
MERKNLPEISSSRNFKNDNIIVVKPSEVKISEPNTYTKEEIEILKNQGKLKILDKQNLGKSIDTLNTIILLVKQFIDFKAQKNKSEAILKEMDKKIELIEKEAEKFIKEEREKRETLVIEYSFISQIVDQIVGVANNDSISDDIKIITIEALAKASRKF